MTQVEHHYQRVYFEGGGFVEATRDDTEEIQDLHYAVWKGGRQIHAGWVIYNIQYDYFRYREWWYGKPYGDYLGSFNGYGHLAAVHARVYPDLDYWEPVTPRGCDYFHEEGEFPVGQRILECDLCVSAGFYIQKDITNPNKKNLNLIGVEYHLNDNDLNWIKKGEEERKNWKKDLHLEKEERLRFLNEYGNYIDERIPLDPRFID